MNQANSADDDKAPLHTGYSLYAGALPRFRARAFYSVAVGSLCST